MVSLNALMLKVCYSSDGVCCSCSLQATKRHKLSKRYLKRLISARAGRLTSAAFPDMEAVEHYAEQSVSSVYYLLLEASGEDMHHSLTIVLS